MGHLNTLYLLKPLKITPDSERNKFLQTPLVALLYIVVA